MKDDCLDENFISDVNFYLNLIRPGLENGKCLFKDGLHNLSVDQIRFLNSCTEEAGCFLVMLSHLIQAYPKNQYTATEEEIFENVKTLEVLLSSVELERHGLIILKYGHNKLDSNRKVYVEMTDKSKNLHQKYGEDAVNHLDK